MGQLREKKESRLLCVFLFTYLHCADGAYEPDRITLLPGTRHPTTYKQFAGYLNGSEDGKHQLFYWFVESQNDPSKDPLALWLNGGPGCSSIAGMLTEHGPFLARDKTGQTLEENDNSWNLNANVIYLESPSYVGYSFETDEVYRTSDDETAEANFQALLSFLQKFPQYKKRDLFIAGQSYAGIYIPLLATRIVQSQSILAKMLKGVAIGNGLLSTPVNENTFNQYVFSHGLTSLDQYERLLSDCACESDIHCDFFSKQETSFKCLRKVQEIFAELFILEGFDMYDITAKCHFGHDETDLVAQNIRFLFYSGDLDAVCNFIGTAVSLKNMGFKTSTSYTAWRTEDGQIGGFWQSYGPNIQYATVKGAGHSVPEDKPAESLRLWRAFLANRYN